MQLFRNLTENLPVEILGAVFLGLVQEEFYGESGDARRLYPWSLVAVCRRWRHLCLDSAPLWAYFRLVSPHENPKPRKGREALRTTLQLNRSLNMPIHIYGTQMYPSSALDFHLRLLATNINRWKVLKIAFADVRISHPSAPLTQVSPVAALSSLQDIAFAGANSWLWCKYLLPFDRETLPSIRFATFSYLSPRASAASDMLNSFPWGRLSSLSLPVYLGRYDDLTTILSQCTSLTNLQLSFHEGVIPPLGHVNRDAPSLPQLTSLDLICGECTAAPFFPHIKAPNLRRFQYGVLCLPAITAFTNFITPSANNSLTILSVQHPLLFQNDYLRIFEILQHLEHLTFYPPEDPILYGMVNCNGFLIAFTRGLAASSSEPNFPPRLKHIELHDLELDPMVLTQMVESRLDALPRQTGNDTAALASSLVMLESVEIDYHDTEVPSLRHTLSAVVDVLGKYVDDGKLALTIRNWFPEAGAVSCDHPKPSDSTSAK